MFLFAILLSGVFNLDESLFGFGNDNKAIQKKLDQILKGIERLNMTDADIINIVNRIDAATTQQGVVLAGEATNLQTIKTEIEALIAKVGDTVPASTVAKLQAVADRVDAISATIQANADFSTAIASEGANNPVPAPVPVPTP